MAVNLVQSVPIPNKQSSNMITVNCFWTIENITRWCSEQIVRKPMIRLPASIDPPDEITTSTEDKKRPVELQVLLYPKNMDNDDRVRMSVGLNNHSGLDIMTSAATSTNLAHAFSAVKVAQTCARMVKVAALIMTVLSMVKANGEKHHLCGAIQRYGPLIDEPEMHRDVIFNPAKGFLSNDCLTLHCELNFIVPEPNKPDLAELQDKFTQPELWTKFYGELLDSGSHWDVTFVLVNDGAQEIRAIKSILAARCRVFADMFDWGMATTNRVEIVKTRVEVFKLVLKFIYTGKVERTSLDAIAKDLLICADKYQLDLLKSICVEHLFASITTESNLLDLYELAKRHNAPNLTAKVIDFFKQFEAKIQDRFLTNLAADKD